MLKIITIFFLKTTFVFFHAVLLAGLFSNYFLFKKSNNYRGMKKQNFYKMTKDVEDTTPDGQEAQIYMRYLFVLLLPTFYIGGLFP